MPTTKDHNRKLTFIDLFAGAGGLSEGFLRAGFQPVAHVEMDPFAVQTLQTRAAYYYLKTHNRLSTYHKYLRGSLTRSEFIKKIPEEVLSTVIGKEMSDKSLDEIFSTVDSIVKEQGIETIDVIIGGPPCQAYSLVGRAQSNHMKAPMQSDPRNGLYKLYARFLKRYKPKMFVFENVIGIESANGGATWRNIKSYLKRVGYEIECKVQNSSDFGVLQNRNRMIIIGWLKESGYYYPSFSQVKANAVVNDVLEDLPKLTPGKRSDKYRSKKMSAYVKKTGIRTSSDVLTLHASRPNTDQDIEIYKIAIKLWNDGHKRLKYSDLPEKLKTHKNQTAFSDRFKVVEGDEACCHTVLAHLSKDGHYFIHPDLQQHRSITVREAARIQSFPDNYFFEGPRTSQFVQVGNAVPPLMAEGVAKELKAQLLQEREK